MALAGRNRVSRPSYGARASLGEAVRDQQPTLRSSVGREGSSARRQRSTADPTSRRGESTLGEAVRDQQPTLRSLRGEIVGEAVRDHRPPLCEVSEASEKPSTPRRNVDR